jgi:hypothetical protein
MLLSARVLNDVASVNSFEVAESFSWTEGDSVDLYLQLVDASLDTDMKGFYPAGRRYMPPATSTLSVQVQNLDNSKVINRLAIQPFPEDASIWKVTILSTDAIHGTPQIVLTLTEPTKTTRGVVKNAVRVYSTDNMSGC